MFQKKVDECCCISTAMPMGCPGIIHNYDNYARRTGMDESEPITKASPLCDAAQLWFASVSARMVHFTRQHTIQPCLGVPPASRHLIVPVPCPPTCAVGAQSCGLDIHAAEWPAEGILVVWNAVHLGGWPSLQNGAHVVSLPAHLYSREG